MTSVMLYHLSEEPNIEVFVPRPAPHAPQEGEMVWAIDDQHLHNYLFPRDCPRICIMRGPETTTAEWEQLACGSLAQSVITIETAWYERLRSTSLFQYMFDPEPFSIVEPDAGYYIARTTITPLRTVQLNDLPMRLLERNIELRITPSLQWLREQVAVSTLKFSMIRMRNAR
jgi:hypothetical protein